jgi:amino acid permease
MAPEAQTESSVSNDLETVSSQNNENSSSIVSVTEESLTPTHGSSIAGATFNFTNAIIGAGAIGLGGAIAVSGGLISIVLILFFGILTKLSLDLVIRLSVETPEANQSYEGLAAAGLGVTGRVTVLVCKQFYSFGCLVAYIIVIKDNFAQGLKHLIFGCDSPLASGWLHQLLSQESLFTWIVSFSCILPLCLLRDMTPLASFSVISVISMVSIVGIVIYIYFACPDIARPGGSIYENWLQIRPGVLDSLGTFVFTFVSQHTVHLVFGSLKPELRTVKNWKTVSTLSLLSATTVSLLVGVFVYMTFGEATESDIFQIYPQTWMIDVAKLLLCITMVLTFPLPFFTCRELLIVVFIHPFCGGDDVEEGDNELHDDLTEPLLSSTEDVEQSTENPSDPAPGMVEPSRRLRTMLTPKNWLLADDDRQLRVGGHAILTTCLWFFCTGLAIAAPSLGDVLDLVGCFSGTIIAFIVPALLSFKLEGYSHLALLILAVGGSVGTVGTYFSIRKLFVDLEN